MHASSVSVISTTWTLCHKQGQTARQDAIVVETQVSGSYAPTPKYPTGQLTSRRVSGLSFLGVVSPGFLSHMNGCFLSQWSLSMAAVLVLESDL